MSAVKIPRIVVMGVSGCGKSTVAQALADRLQVAYVEGDALHPPANVVLMAAGTPLTDEHRKEWLDAVAATLEAAAKVGVVVTCSALKRAYRDRLRRSAPDLRLVHLHGSPEMLAQRMQTRSGHYMPLSLLQSQLDTLQWPAPEEAAIVLDIAPGPAEIVTAVLRELDWHAPGVPH